jgi:pimeloyl-ACP methyl ester carboxylesterase/tRNA A-37 threonylcarbamoyl transferase component Bud32
MAHPTPEVQSRLAAALAERYRIERTIGAGGMAAVYLATDLRHQRKVALKVLAPELARSLGPARFESEIRVTANLHHPNILPLFDSGAVGEGLLYYVMPYVDGASLRERLRDGAPLAVEEALRIARAIAAALDHAHARGVVHRDIKPENVLLAGDATYVADFGIALTRSDARLTMPGLPIGTPTYMSPEQIEPAGRVDGRTDVYALGCVAFEMLTGRPPFPDPARAMVAHLVDPVPSAVEGRRELPPEVDAAFARALAKDPESRYPRATDFVRALAVACAGGADADTPVSAARTPPWHGDDGRRNRRLAQEIRFCRASDGVRIAFATSGSGPPMVKAANWLSHLEFDAASPVWQHWWRALSDRFRFIRYDERASGLSDWDAAEISFAAWVADLEAVVDAAGLDRFALLGVSKGGAIATAYAARHPERVSHLVIHGAYARGKDFRNETPADRERIQLEIDMVRLGWGGRNPAYRQAFTTMFFPEATPAQTAWFNELQRISASPENAAKILAASRDIDVRELAGGVRCPTLVLHSRGDARVPFAEGRLFASLLPNARFVPLPGNNHIPLEHEPAWHDFLREIDAFFAAEPTP